jgi:hypothetical protein
MVGRHLPYYASFGMTLSAQRRAAETIVASSQRSWNEGATFGVPAVQLLGGVELCQHSAVGGDVHRWTHGRR